MKKDDNGAITEASEDSFITDGLGLNGEIGLRLDLGAVIAVIKAKVSNTSYKIHLGSIYLDSDILTYKISRGLSLVIFDTLILPVELFYEGIKQFQKGSSET